MNTPRRAVNLLSLMAMTLLAQSATAALLVPAQIHDPAGSTHNVRLQAISIKQDGFNKIALALASPVSDVTAAQIDEEGARTAIEIRRTKLSAYLLLPASHGTLIINSKSLGDQRYTFEAKPIKPTLIVAADCQKFQPQFKITNTKLSAFPAMISCKANGPLLRQVMFSTLQDATWFGSNLFESKGKGERWKVFEGKDLSSPKGWNFAWGAPQARNDATLKFQHTFEGEKSKLPPFTFWVGAGLLSESVSTNLSSGSVKGFMIPVGARFMPASSHFFLSAQYSLDAYDIGGGSKNSISTMDLFAGYMREFGRFQPLIALGYRDESLTFKSLDVTSSLAAPMVNLEIGYNLSAMKIGLSGVIVQSTGGDKYSEVDIGIYLEKRKWVGKGVRVTLGSENLSAQSGTSTLKSSGLRLNTLFMF